MYRLLEVNMETLSGAARQSKRPPRRLATSLAQLLGHHVSTKQVHTLVLSSLESSALMEPWNSSRTKHLNEVACSARVVFLGAAGSRR